VVFIYFYKQIFPLTQFHEAIANTWSEYTRDQPVDRSHRAQQPTINLLYCWSQSACGSVGVFRK